MVVYIAAQALFDGISSVPYLWTLIKTAPWLGLLYLVKVFFSGASNLSERNMHGKVVLVTGGTSGVGEATVRALATRGAQIVLLTQHSLGDPFIVDYIEDVRNDTNNHLITAEQVDLTSLHSIRTFATKWIDNAPPRRLDMVVLCGNTLTPSSSKLQSTSEGLELNWQVNYLANFHLLSILSPALRAQPPDRDVRVVFGTCSSYLGGDLLHITQPGQGKAAASGKQTGKKAGQTQEPTKFSPGNAYATSKFALTTFAVAFQKHLAAHKRSDGMPNNTKVLLADPGWCRTPGTRRWLTFGSLFGLLLYLITYPLWVLVLKSPDMGSQSFLFACMEEKFSRAEGGILIKECKERKFLRDEVEDEDVQKKLWEYSEQMVQEAEKRGAQERARAKKEAADKKDEEDAVKEMKDYKEKVGKKDGQKQDGSRRSKKG
ncbi:related to oxidoreductase, short chain dehydrogenase/reductase family [Ramularia collo-cygni]|uniref:Related to oxidoreductase, short chain dehydrogenase/reductase family n=1 Tax=Ramularia collo-cygni TaxID=112498 RepID=A0A2D3VFW1_9PEZI|nr:related to oxidoreductase, short chain dehydrogenase/reductase family [Ramularia collo-cygni]CZT24062.1 related to oxidoreductase, short chain dehydrogenase/reductase family [Ramularia collo-cygni]